MSEPVKRPWSYKPREMICQCGTVFTAHGNRAKYCEACAAEEARKRRLAYKKRKRTVNGDAYIHVCDTPEQIKICMNCTKAACNSGECKAVKEAGRTWHKPSPEEIKKRREKALELRRRGWSYAKIAEELGATEGAINSDFQFMRKAGVEI